MLYAVCCLAVICVMTACRQGAPKPLLSTEEMIQIGMDLRLSETYLSTCAAGQTDLDSATEAVYAPILAHYGISLDEYNQNVRYYVGKPQKMQTIQEEIAKRLRAEADEATAEAAKEAEAE